MTFKRDTENEASFLFVNSDIKPMEKEVLLYDFSDMIGAVVNVSRVSPKLLRT